MLHFRLKDFSPPLVAGTGERITVTWVFDKFLIPLGAALVVGATLSVTDIMGVDLTPDIISVQPQIVSSARSGRANSSISAQLKPGVPGAVYLLTLTAPTNTPNRDVPVCFNHIACITAF